MAYDSLKALIRQYIKTNGEQEITGQILQNVLVEMVNQYPSTDGFATQSWVTSQGYITASALSGYATQSWVTTQLGSYLPLTGGNLNGNLSIYDTMNIYSSSIEWNDSGDYCRIAFDQDGITVTAHGTGYVTANEFIKSNGTSSQFLKADGSVDSNAYITASALSGYATQSWVNTQLGGYLPLTGGNLNGNLSIYDTMNIYSSSIEWNDSGDYCRIAFDDDGITVTAHGTGYVTANEFIKNGGTSAQFLKADGSVDSTAYLPKQGNSFYFITDADMPETAANISTLNAAHRMTLYRNAILMPYQMDNANDGGFIRSRGTSESSAIFEIGMWDDAGAGETIQFNYYPTTSTVNPTYSISVPKKTGTIALTSDLSGYATTSQLADYLPLTGGTLTGDLYLTNGEKINIILIEGRRIVDLNLGYSQISGTEYAWNMYVESALDVSAGLDMDGVFVGSGFKKIDGTSSQFLKADGSVDGNSYLLSSGGTITGNLTVDDILIASSGNLHIFGASGGGNAVVFEVQNSLDVMFNGGFEYFFDAQITAPAFNNTSDLRKKTITGDVLMNLYNVANAPLFKFTWKDEKKYSGEHIGSAAQYWQTVLPELVSIGRDVDMTLAMQYDVIALASAITVAKTVVDHEARIRQLEEKIK